MTLVLRWREVRPVVFRWRGPQAMVSPIYAPNPLGVAAIIGAPGRDGAAEDYEHIQASPLAMWTVNHNLGVRPTVTVLSPGGVEVLAHVVHASDNQALIYFAQPYAGSARCI